MWLTGLTRRYSPGTYLFACQASVTPYTPSLPVMRQGWFAGLLLQLRGPILREIDRLIGGFPALLLRQHRQDAPAVRGDIVKTAHAGGREAEERARLTDVQRRPPGTDWRNHEPVVGSNIEDLF